MPNVQSVERAFAILRCLSSGPAGVSEIAERSHLPKSTVSRLLSTLHDVGAVDQLGDGSDYRIGEAMGDISAAALPGGTLVAVARPALTELVGVLGEDAGLAVLAGDTVHYLDQICSDATVQLRDWTGERIPPHCVSSGLVLLACLPPTQRAAAIPRPLVRFTERTEVTMSGLRRRLDAVAGQETAWVFGEYDDDINSVAAPVRDGAGRVVAAVHVHGPSYRFPGPSDVHTISDHVATAARRISERLGGANGHRPVSPSPRSTR